MTALEQKFKVLLNELSHSLTVTDIEQIQELVNVNELGVAFENFCTQLHERDALCSGEQLDQIAEVGTAMGINSDYWKKLSTA